MGQLPSENSRHPKLQKREKIYTVCLISAAGSKRRLSHGRNVCATADYYQKGDCWSKIPRRFRVPDDTGTSPKNEQSGGNHGSQSARGFVSAGSSQSEAAASFPLF